MRRVRICSALLLATISLTACAADVSSDQLQGEILENPQPKGSFVLTDTGGEPYDFTARTEGKLALLYFGYLNCPDICPVHLAQIAEVLARDPEVARQAEVVFVSVDPGRDTPDAIRDFLDHFDHDFVGLTGTPEELVAAQEAAGIPPARILDDDENYIVDHAGWVIAYAADGLSYSIYPFGTLQSQWSNDLRILAAMS